MTLKGDLEARVLSTFKSRWTERNGIVVPEDNSIKLDNDCVKLDATVLYADLTDSTGLVDTHRPEFSAEIYKAYLQCAAKIITNQGGKITAYDGDRIMAVYVGDSKNTSAVQTALKINYAVSYIIMPKMKEVYPSSQYKLRQVIGIDTGQILVAKTGIRGSNDLVWVGKAANYAAKLCSLKESGYSSYITEAVYNNMNERVKISSNGETMWESRLWTSMNNAQIYRSSWWWALE